MDTEASAANSYIHPIHSVFTFTHQERYLAKQPCSGIESNVLALHKLQMSRA
jgi:hypothetical protein